MNLREALEERDMTAAELIRKSGVSDTTVYHMAGDGWTGGQSGAKTETLAKIARALKATIVVDESKPYYFDIILKEEKK